MHRSRPAWALLGFLSGAGRAPLGVGTLWIGAIHEQEHLYTHRESTRQTWLWRKIPPETRCEGRLQGEPVSSGEADGYPATNAMPSSPADAEWRSSCIECAAGAAWIGAVFDEALGGVAHRQPPLTTPIRTRSRPRASDAEAFPKTLRLAVV